MSSSHLRGVRIRSRGGSPCAWIGKEHEQAEWRRSLLAYYDRYSVAKESSSKQLCARRYLVRGRVQGVGYRYFVERVAAELGLTGYAKNLENGSVEVYAVGAPDRLKELSGYLWKGPRWADVRGVEEQEAPVVHYTGFRIG